MIRLKGGWVAYGKLTAMSVRGWLCAALLLSCGPRTGGSSDPQQDGATVASSDMDGDTFTPAQGDCNDFDDSTYPGAKEKCDGKDHNCNGIVDDICDDDKDGYAVLDGGQLPGGDCDDSDPQVNPAALEVPGDSVDNNCDGQQDEPILPCDSALDGSAASFGKAIELCPPGLMNAAWNSDGASQARSIRTAYGKSYHPQAGQNFILLSTGKALDKSDLGFVLPQKGTEYVHSSVNPAPMPNSNVCYQGPDEQFVHDYTELTLTLKVPTNVNSFSFDFLFVSAEYPEYVDTAYNDKFLALLDSQAFKGNVSFDAKGNPITVNAGFFAVCQTALVCQGAVKNVCAKSVTELQGTGYDEKDPDDFTRPIGGGTGWLTTTAPVVPGETATLRFIIFDERDHFYDSSVLIDHFRWAAQAAKKPVTIQ